MNGRLGSEAMAELARSLHRMGPAGRRNLKTRMEALGQPVAAEARRRAAWSSRIPGAISVRPVVTGTSAGIQVRAAAADAPHARPFEGLGGAGQFRHPVYGNRENWVSQATRPYLQPAVKANEGRAAEACAAAIEDAAREAGFR